LAKKGNDLSIVNTSNAANPITSGFQPLLTVDVWEHAYYIDYRNARAKYLETFGKIIDWKFVQNNFSSEKITFDNFTKL
jgi:Fe-Mn family superoxide dismutase